MRIIKVGKQEIGMAVPNVKEALPNTMPRDFVQYATDKIRSKVFLIVKMIYQSFVLFDC